MTIVFIRTATIGPGKTTQATEFAGKIASFIKDKHGLQLRVLRPIGGNPNRIAWVARHESLAALEEFHTKLFGDKAYWEIAERAGDLFLAGSLHDAIWSEA
jgi:hypothetical protein